MSSGSTNNQTRGKSVVLLVFWSATIFVVEAAIMFALAHVEAFGRLAKILRLDYSDLNQALFKFSVLDAFLLTIVLFPILYFFVFKKLDEKNQALAETEVRLEERVDERTKELEEAVKRSDRHRQQIAALNEMGQLLQVCRTPQETHAVAEQQLSRLFPELFGSLYLIDPSSNVLEKAMEWGETIRHHPRVPARECWALRCGKPQEVGGETDKGICKSICSHMSSIGDHWQLCLPLTAQSEALGTLHLNAQCDPTNGEDDQTRKDWLHFCGAVTETLALAIANLRLREELQHQAFRDPLTRLYNRRYLIDALERELQRSARNEQPLSLIILDVDYFKRCNDTFGHDAGDTVLTTLGTLLRELTRGEDVVARYGGEEFVAILPGADHEAALRRAETLRKEVESLAITHQGKPLGRVTISAGVAVYPVHATDLTALIHAADQALYSAKRSGRNCVTLAGDPGVETDRVHQAGGQVILSSALEESSRAM